MRPSFDRLGATIGVVLTACGSGGSLDPASVNLLGDWHATVPVDYTAPGGGVQHCTARWTQSVTPFNGPDSVVAILPQPVALDCGAGPSPTWVLSGSMTLWVRSGSQVDVVRANNFQPVASMRIVATTRLTGSLDQTYGGGSPLEVRR
jgi:hypothetical protein